MNGSNSIAGLTVMVIDDSNTIRRSAEIFLKQAGCVVVLAENGFDALAKLSDHGPDIVFCDVLMPRLDGYQTCALIKKSPRFRNTPVIMLSSKDGLFDRARGRLVGSEEYLTKPVHEGQPAQMRAGAQPPFRTGAGHGNHAPVRAGGRRQHERADCTQDSDR